MIKESLAFPTRRGRVAGKMTIHEFMAEFPTEEACFKAFVSFKSYPCPCGKEYKYRIKGTKLLSCSCGRKISPFKGTILEKSSTPLKTWFYVIYLFSQSTNGVSAAEIQRQTGVTYKCAWRMGHQIRKLMAEDNQVNTLKTRTEKPLEGIVEADEAYFGGDSRYDVKDTKQGRGTKKATIFGMVERGGKVKAKIIPKADGLTLMELIACNVKLGSTLITDEFKGYSWAIRHGLIHHRINHSKRHYGRRLGLLKVNSNMIEGFWALFKNGCRGTHRYVSRKYLQSYLNEWVAKYNHRRSETHLFWVLLGRLPF